MTILRNQNQHRLPCNALKRFRLMFPVIILLMLTNCSSKKIQSQWQSEAISIDGMADDWNASELLFEEDLKMVYGIGNDAENIRFIMRFNDRRLARRIDMQGLVLWLDPDKKKGIRYIDEIARDRFRERLMQEPGKIRQTMEAGQPSLLGGTFFWIENGMETEMDLSNSEVSRAAASVVQGNYCLEVEVSRDHITDARSFKGGIEICGIDEATKEKFEERMSNRQAPAGMQGRRGGGMGGPMAGGRGGMGRRGGMGDRDGSNTSLKEMFKEKELWVRIQIAEYPQQ